ncbi:CHAT domain-containing protein [Stratiformator vulcanicus]|uniref:CHAT domain protein n=1 Tax=Stratiformator vulcanicus TaxID=2527980 RepID=A0A517R0L4_9PLAN|nr:CHAT domain-containing protein [Stratiformator vulcanicus]QDT37411.1 CHAT domain protein [Stratiformator vulcanicus]
MAKSLETLSPYELTSVEVDQLLRTNPDDARLKAHFTAEELHELRNLAGAAQQSTRGRKRVVYVLPGILGSTLGVTSGGNRDTIWLDPHSIRNGDLTSLAMRGRSRGRVEVYGQFPGLYTRLRWTLWWKGNDVRDYAYDWRLSIDELGAELLEAFDSEEADELYVVAHSMGGLVARSAYAQADAAMRRRIKRVIMLGTPNRGSFSVVQVLDGSNATVQFAGCLDEQNETEDLVSDIFRTLPSIYQMLPHRDVFSAIDLFDTDAWGEANPMGTRLREATDVQESLAPADDKFFLLAGVDQPTVVSASLNQEGRFDYQEHETGGDGTVPLDFALYDGIDSNTRTFKATHNGLVTSNDVINSAAEIIEHGRTQRGLALQTRRGEEVTTRGLTFAALQAGTCYGGRRGNAITDAEAVSFFRRGLISVPGDRLPAPGRQGNSAENEFEEYGRIRNLVVGRRSDFRLELELQHGDLFDVPVRAYVLGIFENVTPGGPARQVDELTGGAVTEFLERRLLNADMGRIFMMPVGRNPLLAEFVVFAGLGSYSQFRSDPTSAASVQKFVARNIVRTLIQSGIDELAMLPVGASSGADVRSTIDNLFQGFVEAVRNGTRQQKFRRVVMCESDDARYEEMREHVLRRSTTSNTLKDVEITIDEVEYGDRNKSRSHRQLITGQEQPVYLTVRMPEGFDSSKGSSIVRVESSLLTSGGKATVFNRAKDVNRRELDDLFATLDELKENPGTKFDVEDFGRRLCELIFDREIREAMANEAILDKHLVVIHDSAASRIPYETMLSGDDFPVLGEGLTRRYLAENLSVTKWLRKVGPSEEMKVLLIFDPTDDLPGAEKEGIWIYDVLRKLPGVKVEIRREEKATLSKVREDLNSGEFDVMHYAGHSFFDPNDRANSGLVLADGVLRGSDLLALERLPALVIFNSCESARIRRRDAENGPSVQRQLRENVGVAEALFRGGIGQFIGTYWPVDDSAAEVFARTFYGSVLGRDEETASVGQAVAAARRAVHEVHSYEWANYVHYGEPHFQLRTRSP